MNPSNRFLAAARLDFAPSVRPPGLKRTCAATALSVLLSLLCDAALVVVGERLFPGDVGYAHFAFSDYATLTCIGVLTASLSWPLMARVSSTPRWLFLRLAVLVTILLWLPDVVLLAKGEPSSAVGVLMVMHLGVALVTYNVLVRVAPVRPRPYEARSALPRQVGEVSVTMLRAVWIAVIAGICCEFALGVASMILVPFKRPDGWLPARERALYLVHAGLGGVIGAGALVAVVVALRSTRAIRLGAWLGLFGVAVAALGGFFTYDARSRSLAMALMFVGSLVSCFSYMTGLVETSRARGPGSAATKPGLARPGIDLSAEWLSSANRWWPSDKDQN